MIYQLVQLWSDWPGARLMNYISFRAIVAGIMGLVISVWIGNWFIQTLRRRHISETQRDEKTDPFNIGKTGVPTMGGIVIIAAILIPCLLVGKLHNIYLLMMIITTVLLGTIGFVDDYIKTFRHNKDGLNGWVKIAGQVTLGLIIGLTLRYSPHAVMIPQLTSQSEIHYSEQITRNTNNTPFVDDLVIPTTKTHPIKSTQTTIPFFKKHNCNYANLFSWLGVKNKYRAGWIFFVLITIFIVAAVSNGANLNDGMDGMCAGNSAIMGVALIALAYISGHIIYADYFDVMYIPGSEEIVVFMSSFVGALIGFIWWNGYPAQVFMGDTGSLTIGGIIGVAAILIHKELLLPILCGVFLVESLSVILQTQVYKVSKRFGKHIRLWKRTPIHDHFRTSVEQVITRDPDCHIVFRGNGKLQHETKIVLRFCIITLILASLTLLTLKIR